jgi:hypothetical protein
MTIRKLRKPAPLENANATINRAGTTAGVVLLFMAALSGFGYLFAVKGLVIPGNAVKTASKISAHESLFRFGFLSLFVVAALDAVVAWLLFRVFAPVNRKLSAVAAWGRTAYAAIFVVAISELTGVPGILSPRGGGSGTTSQIRDQVLHRINSFNDIWNVSLILFGLYLISLAYLAYRSGFVPRLISILLGMAGFAYLIDSFTALTIRATDTPLSTVSAASEFVFALWLIIRGRRITLHTEADHGDSIVAAPEETAIKLSSQNASSIAPTRPNPTNSK